MYAGDVKGTAPIHPDSLSPNGPQPEGGQALEVVELANGETIWYVFLSEIFWLIRGIHVTSPQVYCERVA